MMSYQHLVQIADDSWEHTGTAARKLWGRLSCSIQVNGLPMHVEAYAVRKTADDLVALSPEFDDEVEQVKALDSGVRLRTLRILGRDYLLCITPYGE